MNRNPEPSNLVQSLLPHAAGEAQQALQKKRPIYRPGVRPFRGYSRALVNRLIGRVIIDGAKLDDVVATPGLVDSERLYIAAVLDDFNEFKKAEDIGVGFFIDLSGRKPEKALTCDCGDFKLRGFTRAVTIHDMDDEEAKTRHGALRRHALEGCKVTKLGKARRAS